MKELINTMYKHRKVENWDKVSVDEGYLIKYDLKNLLLCETGDEGVVDFIDSQINLNADTRILLSTENNTYVNEKKIDNLRVVINLNSVNHIRNINKYLVSIHKLLPDTGIIIGNVETYSLRKDRIFEKFKMFGKAVFFFDFIFNRVFPRLFLCDRIYKLITRDSYHVLSKAEMLGRVVYNGYDIIDFKEIKGQLYFVAMKTHEPSEFPASFHPLIKLRRVGKKGKMMDVYKFRTMHPYSEYLQRFIVDLNGYNEVGKPANDFRVTSWGKIMRKLWLDELPQLINVILGQMKLVGVRPLSKARFEELPKEVQKARIKHKPGCFPPYVALCMPDSEQNIEAEVIYMRDKEKNPYTTDLKYFFKSVYNIMSNKIRSS